MCNFLAYLDECFTTQQNLDFFLIVPKKITKRLRRRPWKIMNRKKEILEGDELIFLELLIRNYFNVDWYHQELRYNHNRHHKNSFQSTQKNMNTIY